MSAVIHRVRTDRRVAIGLVVAVLFLVAWIAWAVHVWNENGSDAGLGVLVSWPAALAALALIASPFVAVAWLLRNREEGANETAASDAEDEEDNEASEDDPEPASDDEGSEDADDDGTEGGRGETGEGDDGEDEAAAPETEEKPVAKAKARSKPKKAKAKGP